MAIIFDHASIITEDAVVKDGAIVINDSGIIEYVGPSEVMPVAKGQYYNLKGYFLSPGFIDIHTHGGYGVTFGHDDLESELRKYATWVARSGVTGFLCSIAAADPSMLTALIHDYADVLSKQTLGATCYGLHLEGPFINPVKKGAFHAEWLRNPDYSEANAFIEAGKGWIKQITIAPELPGANQIAELFSKNGIQVALGHSNADFDIASNALKHAFAHVTHTYNAQSGFNHRNPGVVGAILTSENATAEIIADMVHIHPAAIKLLVKCLGKERIVAITDAMAGAGLQDGQYTLVGQDVIVKDAKATLANGTIAGSCSILNQCVRNMIKRVDIPMIDAIKMASLNPARVIKMASQFGSIKEGKRASLIVIDEDIHVYLTMVKGEVVYKSM